MSPFLPDMWIALLFLKGTYWCTAFQETMKRPLASVSLLLTGGNPRLYFGPCCAVRHVGLTCSGHVFSVLHDPLASYWRNLGWRIVSGIVQPPMPFRGYLAAVVVEMVLIPIFHPAVPPVKEPVVFEVLVAEFVRANQRTHP